MSLITPRPISGRYSGAGDRFAVDLRIDIDGPRPTRRVSADYYRDGAYFGSMRLDAPHITSDRHVVRIVGNARFSWPSPSPLVTVTIPRPARGASLAPATLAHSGQGARAAGVYTCEFDAPSFRHVTLHESREARVTPFRSYDTSALPSGGSPRRLSLESAYGEAGIEIVRDSQPNVVDPAAAGANGTWCDAELQAAMHEYFGQLDDRPQWVLWLLHAWSHDDPGIYGLMFDRRGRQRQGCAIFYAPISTPDMPSQREQLMTCVHEIGHGFNLLHSWQKSCARPPVPSRPAALSWMNYPKRFPRGGAPAFWSRFGFQFDDLELAHLRHAFEEDVIMGGNPLEGGAANRNDDLPISGALRVRISAPPVFGAGVPVTIAIEIAVRTAKGEPVPTVIGPRAGTADVLVRGPDGREMLFEPLLRHCHGDDAVTLTANDAPRRDYAFIHYGKDGFAFERPGRYAIRVRHVTCGGAVAVSNLLTIDVGAPQSRDDRQVARLVAGNGDVGALMSLAGSGASSFDGANRTLDEVIALYPAHAMAAVARVVRATSLARPFKLVADAGLTVRPAEVARAVELVRPVIDLARVYGDIRSHDPATRRREAAAALVRVGIRRGVPATVAAFIRSRRLEIAIAVSTPQMIAQVTRAAVRRPTRRPVDPGVGRRVPPEPVVAPGGTVGGYAAPPEYDVPPGKPYGRDDGGDRPA